jgi:hypothetical protein
MPSQLLSSQKGAEGAGGPRAPQNALSRTHHPAGGPSAKNLKDYVMTIGKALERLNLGTAEREAWESIKKHLSGRDKENETRDAPDAYGIEELRKEIQTLAKTVGKLAEGSKQQSWAQVARPAQLAPQLPARRSREVLVTCDEGTSAQSNKSAAEIVAEVQSSAGGKGEIIGARKLPSGAIALTFKSVEAKNQWKDQDKVASVFGLGATIKETTLDVIVFGFPARAISGLRPEQRLSAIISQNQGLGSSLKRVGVLKSTITRRYEAVILGFASPQAANAAIEAGVLWEASVLNAEPFTKSVRLARCFQCQSYSGHTARFCRSQARCGWCATTGHTLDNCPDRQNPNKKACAPCGGKRGHCALDKHCPTRQKEEERARAAYDARPVKFDAPDLRSSARREVAPLTLTPTLAQSQAEESEDEGFLVVGSKRRRGRPTAISKASTTGIPNIASFLQVPSTQFGATSVPSSLASIPSSLASLELRQETRLSSNEEEMTDSPSQ